MAKLQATPSAVTARAPRQVTWANPDLENEVREALADFERGDYIELTVEELEQFAEIGESPWPDASLT
jgi:hypothetical protein